MTPEQAEETTTALRAEFARTVEQMTEFGWTWTEAAEHMRGHMLAIATDPARWRDDCARCPWPKGYSI